MSNPLSLNLELNRAIDRFVHLESLNDFKFLKITHFDHKLIIRYTVKDKDLKNKYEFEVENTLITQPKEIRWQTPILRLLSPKLKVNLDIHMLTDGQICYTFPGDIRYNRGLTCGYAIEQSFKWSFGFEFYLKNNYWPFPEMPHGIYPIYWGFSRPFIAA